MKLINNVYLSEQSPENALFFYCNVAHKKVQKLVQNAMKMRACCLLRDFEIFFYF